MLSAKRDKQGNEKIIFRPVSALETPAGYWMRLCDAYNDAKNDVDPLIVDDAMFILDFLMHLSV